MSVARPTWRIWLRHWTALARDLVRATAGKSREAKMAMIAITTSSSISVKARRGCRLALSLICRLDCH